jgi:MoxR-like ATPase
MPEAEERRSSEDIKRTIREELYLPEDFDLDALITAVKNGNVLLYGPPGTGKTKLAKMLASKLKGTAPDKLEGTAPEIHTANSLWFRRDVIGGETIVNDSVQWKSGFLIRACNTAGMLERSRYHFIIIDEMNRADADKAFGDFFTIFSSLNPDDWEVPASLIEEIKSYNGRIDEEARDFLRICGDRKSSKEVLKKIRIIATINTADVNNLYLLGEALLRRFYLIKIPCVKSEKTSDEVNFLIRKNGYAMSEETKSAFVNFVKSLRAKFEGYAQSSDYENKRLGEFCISTAAVERALKMISEMGSVTQDRFPLLLKMSLGTIDENILKEIR